MRRIGAVSQRNVPNSPDGGVIVDYDGPVGDPALLAGWLASIPGVIEHGLFPPELVATALVGRGRSVQRTDLRPQAPAAEGLPTPDD
jgi:ribose 5-phosphate isomerase A